MKTKILTILRNSEEYVSGQDLCIQLGVSRTAVWKVINQLKEEGYIIEAIQNKGYKLLHDPDLLGESGLKSRLSTKWTGSEIFYKDETGSTNADAKRLAEEGSAHGTVTLANVQKDGRGRRGRNWNSPGGSNIYFSLLLRPDFSPVNAPGLTLVMALSVTEAIENLCNENGCYENCSGENICNENLCNENCSGENLCNKNVLIKWPNDIVINGKKICGILTEMNAEMDFIHYVVVGVGINVNQEEFPEDLMFASSLLKEFEKKFSRTELIADILERFEINYETYNLSGNMELLMEKYNQHLANKNNQVRVLDQKEEFQGVALGINENGELLVKKSDGTIAKIFAGEVSVRGIYGYI